MLALGRWLVGLSVLNGDICHYRPASILLRPFVLHTYDFPVEDQPISNSV